MNIDNEYSLDGIFWWNPDKQTITNIRGQDVTGQLESLNTSQAMSLLRGTRYERID